MSPPGWGSSRRLIHKRFHLDPCLICITSSHLYLVDRVSFSIPIQVFSMTAGGGLGQPSAQGIPIER